MKEAHKGANKRRYLRLKSVFPVEFQLTPKENTSHPLSGTQQGFTRNVSTFGICLEVNNLKEDLAEALRSREARLSLTINIPLFFKPVKATADCVWIEKTKETHSRNKYLIGVSYRTIDKQEQFRIIRYARKLYWIPRITVLVISALILVAAIIISHDIGLQRENRALVTQLISVLEKRGEIENKLTDVDTIKNDLEEKLINADKKMMFLQGETARAINKVESLTEKANRLKILEEEFNEISQVKQKLEKQLAAAASERTRLKESLSRTEEIKTILEGETVEMMYGWLLANQDEKTGLVRSFEGNDSSLMDVAFTFDQALAAQSFIIFGNYSSAEKIFEFYHKSAPRLMGAFANAYDAVIGNIREYTVHTGPNSWLGIAVLQYTNKTGNRKYLDIASNIGDWLISIQQEDAEGGIRGGPKDAWFSTEHNIDAYALFTMLSGITGDDKYRIAADRAMAWLRNVAYNESEGRFNRGKNDSTVATDTASFAIAAIGPQKLKQEGIDPDRLMEFAENNCRVTVDYQRPDGKRITVTGFDFTNPSHIGRPGVVSSEWTAQMVVAFKSLAEFYHRQGNQEKAGFYRQKAKFYWEELGKLAIVKPGAAGAKGGGVCLCH